MKGIKIPHPLNPNLRHSIDVSFNLIGGGIEFDDLIDKLKTFINDNVSDEKQRQALLAILGPNETFDNNEQKALTYYAIVYAIRGEELPKNSKDVERYALDELYKGEPKPAGLFQQLETTATVVPVTKRRYEELSNFVYDTLFPLHLFIGQLENAGGGSKAGYNFKWKENAKTLDERMTPIIITNVETDNEFRKWNRFLGKTVLDKMLDNDEKEMTEEFFWENVDIKMFGALLSFQTLGAITTAWDRLGRKYDSFKIYIYSEDTRNRFAELTALLTRASSGGNAYPSRIDGGGRMNYNVGGGLALHTQNQYKIIQTKDWFDDVYKVKDKYELKK